MKEIVENVPELHDCPQEELGNRLALSCDDQPGNCPQFDKCPVCCRDYLLRF